jgi:uncharacterized protein YdhG (YjbR/CyaY superfamily)
LTSKSNASKKSRVFTDEEKAAMRERVKEQRAGDVDGDSTVLAKIATMSEPDRTMAKRVHTIIKASSPDLVPRLWYGMPAYSKDGNVICFFQPGEKFKTRYATLGFSDEANLDEGSMWPTGFALKALGGAEEARIIALVKKAVG